MVKKSWLLLGRYSLFLFIPVSLGIAYYYISSQLPQYKVTAKIALKGIPQDSAINGIRSKYLISKALDQLPFQASYYFADIPQKEIYPDSSPVKLVVRSLNEGAAETWISLEVRGSTQFEMARGDTSEFFKFNEPIIESYGKFTVLQNTTVKDADRLVNVKIESQAAVLNRFYDNLKITRDNKGNEMTLTVVTGNAQKGASFLNTLFRLYGKTIHQPAKAAETLTTQYDTVVKPGKDVSALKEKATALTSQIENLKAQSANLAGTAPVRRSNLDKGQAKIYQAVDSYVKKPIDEFVQVPYVDEIEDPELNDQVSEFNEAELSRRNLTGTRQIDSANRKLMTLRSNIVERINAHLRNEGSASNRTLSRNNILAQIQSKEHQLAQLKKDIETAGAKSYTVVKTENAKAATAIGTAGLVVLDKPGNNIEFVPVNSLLIYGIALIAGILFPFAGWVIRSARRNASSRKLLDKEKLSEKLNDIFAVKQID